MICSLLISSLEKSGSCSGRLPRIRGKSDKESRVMLCEGTVVRVFGRFYTVRVDGVEYDCTLRGSIKLDPRLKGFANPAAVGDLVTVSLNNSDYCIESVNDRTNKFSRKEKGKNTREDLIAANIDQLLIIQSYAEPVINPRFVDRLAVRAIRESIAPVLVINKYDLAIPELEDAMKDYYASSGLTLIDVCARNGYQMDKLYNTLSHRRTILAGNSGVGKSSLLNALFPSLSLRTNVISEKSGKGCHTTTNVIMYTPEAGLDIIDTPGVREFGLVDITSTDLARYFYEFASYSHDCAFADCLHDREPQCGVKDAVEEGIVDEERYISYLNILESLREYELRRYR